MEYAISRIHVWSAAKVGAILGCLIGLILGTLGFVLTSLLAPLGQFFDQPIEPIGMAGVVLITLLNGSAFCCLFAVISASYNLTARLGAALRVSLEVPAAASLPTRSERGKPALSPMSQTSFDSEAFSG
jgi:hypothetical protein